MRNLKQLGFCGPFKFIAPQSRRGEGAFFVMSTNSFGVPVGDLVRRFFSGWIYELQALVPEKICRALREDARRLCIVIRETGYEIQAGRGLGAPQTSRIVLAHGDLNEIGQILQSEMRRWGPLLTVSVRVPTFACLARVRSLPKASLREADSLLLIELEHSTPFKSEDVFWGWHPISTPSKEPIVIEQLIFKRSRIASLIDALSKFKLHLVAIEVEDEDNHLLPVSPVKPSALPLPDDLVRCPSWRRSRRARFRCRVDPGSYLKALQIALRIPDDR